MAKLGNIVQTFENLSESGQLGATEDAVEAANTATDVAEGNAEVVEDAAELDNIDTGVDDAFEAVDRIEELKDVAEGAMQEGGLTEDAAKTLEIAHESIMSSLGLSHRKTNLSAKPVTTFESYRSSTSRAHATMVTLESLGDSIKTVVENIKRALKAALNMVQNFVAGLIRNRSLMDKHLTNLESKLKAIPSTAKPKSPTVKGGANSIRVDGKASAQTALQVLESSGKLIQGGAAVAASVAAFSATANWVNEFNASLKKVAEALGAGGSDEGKKGYGHLSRGRSLVLVGGEEAGEASRVELAEVQKKVEAADAPSVQEMSTVVRQAKSVLQALGQYERAIKDLQKGAQSALSSLESGYKAAAKGSEQEDDKKTAGDVKAASRTVISALNKFGSPIPTAAFDAVKSAADFVTAGINNFSTAEKKAEGEKK